MADAKFEDLLGDVIIKFTASDTEITFLTIQGKKYKMSHQQDCCESVYVEDITGDLNDILDHPILLAEEVSEVAEVGKHGLEYVDSGTWTFYKLATVKANATIRWLGMSNGYYSEAVDFEEISTYD